MKKAALALAPFFLLAGCFERGDDSPAASGDVVATVNGVGIPRMRVSIYMQAAQQAPSSEVIDNVITGEVISQAAAEQGIDKIPEIAAQLEVARQTVLGRAYTQHFLNENQIDDAAVDARYEELKGEYGSQFEYRTAHILVPDKDLADDIYSQVSANPQKFGELAREHSKDPGSAAQDGELGWTDPRSLVPEYSKAMQETEPGNLAAAPVETQFGWHVIRVDEKRPLEAPQLDDQMRERLRQSLQAELFSKHLEEIRAAAEIVRS